MLLVVQTVVLVVVQAHMYADGVFYLYWVLDTGWPLDVDFGRHFAHLATQWPTALAIQAGVNDIPTLSRILGLGLYLPSLAGIACCAWVAGDRRELLLFPLLTAAGVTANSTFFVVSESHLLVAVFWPLLFLLTLREDWGRGTFAIAATLAFPTLRSYESMALLGPFLAGSAAWRAWRAPRSTERLLFATLALYFCAGIAVAGYFILNPRVPGNYESFLGSLRFYRDHLGHVNVLGVISVSGVVLCAGVLLLGAPTRRWARAMLAVFGVAGLTSVALPLLRPSSLAPLLQYHARVLNVYLPPILALVFFVGLARSPRPRAWTFALALTAILSLAQTGWHVVAARAWAHYLEVFREEVAAGRGLVPYAQSTLSRESVDGYPIATMNWEWTMPTMSIVLAPEGRVRALIDNPSRKYWQPFEAANPAELPKFSRYGVRYDEYVAALTSQ